MHDSSHRRSAWPAVAGPIAYSLRRAGYGTEHKANAVRRSSLMASETTPATTPALGTLDAWLHSWSGVIPSRHAGAGHRRATLRSASGPAGNRAALERSALDQDQPRRCIQTCSSCSSPTPASAKPGPSTKGGLRPRPTRVPPRPDLHDLRFPRRSPRKVKEVIIRPGEDPLEYNSMFICVDELGAFIHKYDNEMNQRAFPLLTTPPLTSKPGALPTFTSRSNPRRSISSAAPRPKPHRPDARKGVGSRVHLPAAHGFLRRKDHRR